MTRNRWQHVSQIYHAALERHEGERAAFLNEACAGDEELRREVDSLLRQGSVGPFLETPALDMAAREFSPPVNRSLVGRQIRSLRILSFLGAGAMGEVYRARDTRLGRDVAIKVLPAIFAREPARLARFQREAQLLAALNHPHIATIHSLEELDGSPALVLELVDGPTLADVITSRTTSPSHAVEVREALGIARQLAEALAAAHAKGIIHRDLKPANIKIAPGDIVKVLDFGVAKAFALEGTALDASQLSTVTASASNEGRIIGTPTYMSPEQARGKPIDKRTDIWAFGCVMYEMLTGYPAFDGETISDTVAAILEREPDWKALPANTPAGIHRLLRHCLKKEAQQRLHDIADARIEIDEALQAPVIDNSSESPRPIESVAVLPFANASGDPQMEYLSDGLTESIILSLSQLSQLRVMARSSVFRFKGRNEDPREIGLALGVAAVATGRVLQRGETLMVSAELVDVKGGWQLWGAQYKRTAADIFATEEDIAKEIFGHLRLKLIPDKRELLAKRYTENVEAYHLYLKGKFHWGKRTEEGLRTSLQYFRQAIEVDPTYALAYAGLAEGYMPMVFYGHLSPRDAFPKARAAAQKALDIDPLLSEARTVLGSVKRYERDRSGAEEELRMVLDRDPNYGRARQVLAEIRIELGRTAEAVTDVKRALEGDPLSLSMNAALAMAFYYAHQYDEAIEQCRRTIEMDAHFYPAYWFLGLACEQKMLLSEAVSAFREASALSNNSTLMLASLGGAYAAAKKEREAREVLQELRQLTGRKYVSQLSIAVILLRLGEQERALACLEQAHEERCAQLCFLKVDPRLDSVRAEPRVQSLMRRMGVDTEA